MVKVLFVCTGNICRSPTAHAVMRKMAQAQGLDVEVGSAGTHAYHVGHPSDQRSSAEAARRGYDMSDLRARQVSGVDFETYDYVLCMDAGHKATLERAVPQALHHKIHMFDERDVGDPYYGEHGFEKVFDQIEAGCRRWLQRIKA